MLLFFAGKLGKLEKKRRCRKQAPARIDKASPAMKEYQPTGEWKGQAIARLSRVEQELAQRKIQQADLGGHHSDECGGESYRWGLKHRRASSPVGHSRKNLNVDKLTDLGDKANPGKIEVEELLCGRYDPEGLIGG